MSEYSELPSEAELLSGATNDYGRIYQVCNIAWTPLEDYLVLSKNSKVNFFFESYYTLNNKQLFFQGLRGRSTDGQRRFGFFPGYLRKKRSVEGNNI